MVNAFIFDLDGVITNTANLHYKAWKNLAEEIGISIDRTFNEHLKGVSRLESLEIILKSEGKQNAFSNEEKVQLATKKNKNYKKLINEITPKDILPNMKTLLENISRKGYLLGLASASENAPTIIKALRLEHYFQVIVDPTKVEQGKPAPDIFLLAASQLGITPKKCIGIEDAESGVEAIKRAKMFAVGVGDQKQLHKADYIVHSTSELYLPNMLMKWEKWYHAQ